MPTLIIKNHHYNTIYRKLRDDRGLGGMLSWRLRADLGLRIRHYRGYDTRVDNWVDDVRFDFDDEPSLTFFRLKYFEYLPKEDDDRIKIFT